jgi:predicted O-methyltransferase YrrM
MTNFGMFWPIDNFIGQLTEEENTRLQARRNYLGDMPEIVDVLFWLAVKSGAKNIVEIGVGHSTVPLILAARRNGGTLFSTDIGTLHSLEAPECANIWTWRPGIDSVEMGKQWRGGGIDFLYLDTSHTYEQTTKELETWMPHMKVGGWFVLHDVASCINTVFKAVADYIIKVNDKHLEYHQYPFDYGFGILIRRD